MMGKTKTAAKGRTLHVRNPAARRLAEELSRRRGVTLSDAVIGALEEKIREMSRPVDRAKVDALCREIRSLPVLDRRAPEEILGYDEFEVPR